MAQQVTYDGQTRMSTRTINNGLNSDYAPYLQWNSDGDLWTQGFGTIRGNLENSLMNGSMTATDIPVELGKMDDAIDDVIAQLP